MELLTGLPAAITAGAGALVLLSTEARRWVRLLDERKDKRRS